MQNHPIPQNVTAYEFHIVGNMTLKQFVELGIGIGVAVLFYSTNLHNYIKWPLVGASALGGAAVAFMPFDGRPLDRMILAFFKAVYTPSQFIWRKSTHIPNYFTYKPKSQKASDLDLEKQKLRKNLGEYLSTLPQTQQPEDYDQTETAFINKINQLFDSTPAAKQVTQGTDTIIPATPQVRVRKIKPAAQVSQASQKISQTIKSASITPETNSPSVPPATSQPKANQPLVEDPSVPPIDSQPKADQPMADVSSASPAPTGAGARPELGRRVINPPIQESSQTSSVVSPPSPPTPATQSPRLPFPTPPSTPNTIVGMVLNDQGKIVENAIIEIRDKNHQPLRALKTNKLGQFFSATPLENGTYEIEAEKDNHHFNLQKLTLNGQVIPPLEIRAKPPNPSQINQLFKSSSAPPPNYSRHSHNNS